MRLLLLLCGVPAALLTLACGSAAPEDDAGDADEGALAEASPQVKQTVLDAVTATAGQSVSWVQDTAGQFWRQNGETKGFGPAGKAAIYTPSTGWWIGGAAVHGDVVTLVVGGAGVGALNKTSPYFDAVVRFDTAGKNVATVVPMVFAADGHAVDRTNTVFYNDVNGDLKKVDVRGNESLVAPSMLAARRGKDCTMTLMVDERLVHGVMRCPNGPAEIVRVSKDGGSSVVVAGAQREITDVQQTDSDIYFVADGSLRRLPKAGGAAQVLIPKIEEKTGPHVVHANELWSIQKGFERVPKPDAPNNVAAVTSVVKRPLTGGPSKQVGRVAPVNPAAFLTVKSLVVNAQGVTLSTQESTKDGRVWEHRLVRLGP